MINILCIEKNDILLEKMFESVSSSIDNQKVLKLNEYNYKKVRVIKPDVVFINYSEEAISLAKEIYDSKLETSIIILIDDKLQSYDAMKVHASGVILKPYTANDLKEELTSLKMLTSKTHKVEVKTFGNFDIFVDGKNIKFARTKSKELLAYLIDKKGTSVSSSELIVNLWEEHDVCKTTRSMLHNLISDIKDTLIKHDILDIIEMDRNAYRIICEKVSCDYFDLLNGKKSAYNKFTGEYMAAYEWAMFTASTLENICGL
jgi:two-component SAPR family response regulator